MGVLPLNMGELIIHTELIYECKRPIPLQAEEGWAYNTYCAVYAKQIEKQESMALQISCRFKHKFRVSRDID